MKLLPLAVLCLVGCHAVVGQSFTGEWKGDLNVNGIAIPLVLHIQQADSGYTATADSPKQGAFDLPAKITVIQDSLDVVIQGGLSIRGRLSSDSTMNTVFRQGGAQLPLALSRQSKASRPKERPRRPQDPQEPHPYDSEDFVAAKDSMTVFGGTITSPKAQGKYPAVILISGSGQQNRDEELFGHKPFKVLADYLTRNGFVVLRFDDIGVGDSKGDLVHLTTLTQAEDVAFLVGQLARHPKADASKIGLVGHSEGGVIAPIVASRDQRVKYIVSLAGMAIPGHELMQRQMVDFGGLDGMTEEKRKMHQDIFAAIKNNLDPDSARDAMQQIIDQHAKANMLTAQDTIALSRLFHPWYLSFVHLDPAVYLKKLTIPVMALNGAKDVQVIAQDNLAAFKRHLPAHKRHVFKSYPDLNHLFQTAETGAATEYAEIEETFHEPVMKDIVDWIKGL